MKKRPRKDSQEGSLKHCQRTDEKNEIDSRMPKPENLFPEKHETKYQSH
jgi:hypothetical protein